MRGSVGTEGLEPSEREAGEEYLPSSGKVLPESVRSSTRAPLEYPPPSPIRPFAGRLDPGRESRSDESPHDRKVSLVASLCCVAIVVISRGAPSSQPPPPPALELM